MADRPDVSSDDAGLSIIHDTSSANLFCEPCKEDGYYYEAEGYCVDCNHHLCKSCFQHHRTPRPMRHHKLLNKHEMPQTKTDQEFKDECRDKCSVHGDEILKYFCEDHNMFGCTVCVTLKHRTCQVGYIPTLSADLFNTEEYKSFKACIESMIGNTNCIHNTATSSLEDARKYAEAVFVKIRHFRKEINTFFDELENEISTKLLTIREETEKAMAEILKESKRMEDKLMNIEKEMKENEDKAQKCRLFVDMKQLGKTIRELKKDISTMETNNTIKELSFKPSDSVTSFVRNKAEAIGSLVPFHETLPLDCGGKLVFTDIAVLSRERIAIKCINTTSYSLCIVLIDTTQTPRKVMDQMEFYSFSGITKVNEDEIAVTTDNGNIQIYSVTDKFLLNNTIKNAGLYHAIAYTNGLFIGLPLYSQYKLRIVNLNGDVMKTFPVEVECTLETGGYDYTLCYIAVHPDLKTIYVSDWVNKTVTCLTFEGEVKAEYTPGYEWQLQGVAVSSDGLVYVSDSKNNNIHILTSDLKPHEVLIGTKYGIDYPRGLAVCDRERKLYVGMAYSKSISVFNI